MIKINYLLNFNNIQVMRGKVRWKFMSQLRTKTTSNILPEI